MTIAPTVHLNGTGKETLTRELRTAVYALMRAREAVAAMTIHMRDFYVRPDGGSAAFDGYRQAQRTRLDYLDLVRAELETIYLAIDAQDR